MHIANLDRLDAFMAEVLSAARIPGAALAVVVGDETVFAKGYGYRDWARRLPMRADTRYPIASTSKAMNSTLLGMLVDEGRLSWDAPVQSYAPAFLLQDPVRSAQVTARDLITMRTGLPRHDWVWTGNSTTRADLFARLRYLELSAGLRERFQYNNLTTTAAGHVAELITGRTWEQLIQERLFDPLAMTSSGFSLPGHDNVTVSYHETERRELVPTRRLPTEATAPSGGAIWSTVEDMGRWMSLNLRGGEQDGRQLIQLRTLRELHATQIPIPPDPLARKPNASYAMGWTVDTYCGSSRIAHGGYIHDVDSEVTLFPEHGVGIVAFTNFGPVLPALLLNEHVFDLLRGVLPRTALSEQLAHYERCIEETRRRHAAVRRIGQTSPSHMPEEYAGHYAHPGYGPMNIERCDAGLILLFNSLSLAMEHWHYDTWSFLDSGLFPIHQPHAFEPSNRVLFETNADGAVAALSVQFEPAVAPIRFVRR
ncbi:MAG TPA: serine hydrolase [Steroidobacteraceae bacterium]|jgi:CubicO group peptidase (beta-lactamase class C family)|nr:serine hydrolase [Steroidobacteraceae bacterium]